MTRSFAENFGLSFPPNAAYLIKRGGPSASWQSVTWAEILEERRKKQARVLKYKRAHPKMRAVLVSVRGRHTYIEGIGGFSEWLRGGSDRWKELSETQLRLMEMFPMPQRSLFDVTWKEWVFWFARTYKRGTFNGQPRGVAYCWALCEGEGGFTRVRELVSVIQSNGVINGQKH